MDRRSRIAQVMQAEILYLDSEEKRNPQMEPKEHREHMLRVFKECASNVYARGQISLPRELRPHGATASDMVSQIEETMRQEGGRMKVLDELVVEMLRTQMLGTELQNSRVFLKIDGVVKPLLGEPRNQSEADRLHMLEAVIQAATLSPRHR